jgi:hypothetical protein
MTDKQLHDLRDEVLVDKYPYDEFRRDMLGFIDDEILHTLISQSVSEAHTSLPCVLGLIADIAKKA